MTETRRLMVAKRLFRDWTQVTESPDLLGAAWNSLSSEDKQVWLDRAAEKINAEQEA